MNRDTLKISLAAARVNARLTQEEVAKEMKVSKNTIVAWEKEASEPSVSQARKLAEMFKIDLDHIFFADYIK